MNTEGEPPAFAGGTSGGDKHASKGVGGLAV